MTVEFPSCCVDSRRIFERSLCLGENTLEHFWLRSQKLLDIPCAFSNIAGFTRDGQVAHAIGSALASGMNMLNLERHVFFCTVGAFALPLFQQVLSQFVSGKCPL